MYTKVGGGTVVVVNLINSNLRSRLLIFPYIAHLAMAPLATTPQFFHTEGEESANENQPRLQRDL